MHKDLYKKIAQILADIKGHEELLKTYLDMLPRGCGLNYEYTPLLDDKERLILQSKYFNRLTTTVINFEVVITASLINEQGFYVYVRGDFSESEEDLREQLIDVFWNTDMPVSLSISDKYYKIVVL